jgi:hypothetical protein
MSNVYRRVLEVCWGLGLICTLGTIVVRVLRAMNYKPGVTSLAGAIMAAVFFLGALATGEARRTLPPS